MKLKFVAPTVLSALILAVSPIAASADQTYTMNGSFIMTGDLFVDGLLSGVGDCVQIGASGKLTSSGSVCGGGGGGVTSVTSNSSNLTASPTTGDVQLDFSNSPTFSGDLTANNLIANTTVTGLHLKGLELTSGQCLTTDGSNEIVSTGSACASPGVTSVTAGPSGNQTFSPTTGAVVGDIVENPTFTGTITDTAGASATFQGITMIGTPGTYGDNNIMTQDIQIANGTGIGSNFATIFSANNPLNAVAGVQGQLWTLGDGNGTNAQMAVDPAGNLGVFGVLSAQSLAGSVGDCLQASTNGQIVATGSACGTAGVTSVTPGASGNLTFSPSSGAVVGDIIASPVFGGTVDAQNLTVPGTANMNTIQSASFISPGCLAANGASTIVDTGVPCGTTTTQIQHGNQIITAVAGTCVAGTPVTFSPSFLATPDITGSTEPVVGDTMAPSSITTSGFTPELCSTVSNAAATIYWSAQN